MDEAPEPSVSAAPGPLTGLTVVEIGDEKGEYAGLILGGLGAEVIKVEPPAGAPSRRIGPFYKGIEDPERSLHFWAYNRGKQSVVLDLADTADAGRLGELLAAADVLVDSTPRGTLAAAGARPDSHPALIHARLTAFGDDGPWADFKTSDLVSLALGGVPMNCGYDPDPFMHYDTPPIAPHAWHSFHIAGEHLAIGILSALIRRVQTGRGQSLSVSMHEAVAKNTEIDLMQWVMVRQPIYRLTNRHAGPTVTEPSISYTKDGRWMLAMSVGKRDLKKLRPYLDKYGLAKDLEEETGEDQIGVRAIAGASPQATSSNEFIQRFVRRFTYENLPWQGAQDTGMLWSPVRKPHENATDEHWLYRGTFADIPHPEFDTSFRYPVGKWISTRGSWRPGRRAPLLNEDRARLSSLRPVTPDPKPSEVADALSALGKPFALQGVRILDFSWFLASAGSTRFLASLGADVLKVEWNTHPDSGRNNLVPVGGRAARDIATAPLKSITDDPGIGGQFNQKNPGKRGLSLNIADPRGLEIAKQLIAKCDVVAEGFSPGVLERWGIGYDVQKTIRPDIIYVKQSGMGAFGNYGRYRAVGPIAAALSGLSEMSGLPEPAPMAGWGYSYLDWFGAYSMALAILTAVYHRDRTGEGQWIDASQTEVGIALEPVPILNWSANGEIWRRVGNRSPYQKLAPQGVYRCTGEDRWVAITCRTDADFSALASAAGHEEWLRDSRFTSVDSRIAHHDELDALISAWTADKDAFWVMHRLQDVGVPAGVCQNAEDKVDHDPQLAHLKWLTELTGTRIGTWPLGETAIKMSETPPHIGGLPNRAAPLYGEDNLAILTELLDYTEDEVAHLKADGVL